MTAAEALERATRIVLAGSSEEIQTLADALREHQEENAVR